MEVAVRVSYRKLPGFPPAAVSGHAGELLIGRMGGTPIIVLMEGPIITRAMRWNRTFAMRTLAAFGITDVLLTNAAAG